MLLHVLKVIADKSGITVLDTYDHQLDLFVVLDLDE